MLDITPILHFAAACSAKTFLGLVPWYYYLPTSNDDNGQCIIGANGTPQFETLGSGSGFLLIAMAIAQDLLRIAALVAVFFIISGGFKFMTSQGSPDSTKQAQQSILHAVIGLVIAILASVIVNYIGRTIGK